MTDNTSDPLFSSSEEDQTPQPLPEDHDYLADLVGDGKKFKDAQTLARSVLHKEMHIKEIEKENAELRQTVKQGLSRDEFLEAIQSLKPSPSNPANPTAGQPERTEVSIEQVKSLVEERVSQSRAEQQQQENLRYAVSEAQKRLGPSYQKLLKDRAKALGENEADLTHLARTRPKLFLELMAPQTVTDPQVPSLPKGEVDTGKLPQSNTGVRDMAFYNALKKSNPEAYKSPQVQKQMHEDALRLREKFFNQ
jgi:hypothetical protein